MHAVTFREMQPIARELVGKLFAALQEEVDQLVAEDKSKMTLVERGRWSAQIFRIMQQLQKAFPEADRNTPEGRQTINRLRTPEEDEAEAAEIDAIFGFNQPSDPLPASNWQEPVAENVQASQEPEPSEPPPGNSEKSPSVPRTRLTNGAGRTTHLSSPNAVPIDYDAEIAEILRRVRPSATTPPS